MPRNLSSKPANLGNAASARVEGDHEISVTPPGVIDKCSTSAIGTADISEAAVLNELLTLPARYRAAKVEVGTNMNVDRYRIGRSR